MGICIPADNLDTIKDGTPKKCVVVKKTAKITTITQQHTMIVVQGREKVL